MPKIKYLLVNFSISSGSHPGKINIKNAWIVENLNLLPNKIDNVEIKNKWPHLKNVKLDFSISRDISILIGADMPTLYIGQEIRKGKPSEPIAIKTILGWVLMGGKSAKYHNFVTSNKLNLQNLDTLLESVEHFLAIRNLWYMSKSSSDPFTENEQKAIKVLEDTVERMTGNHFIGLLWKEHRPVLFNRDLSNHAFQIF